MFKQTAIENILKLCKLMVILMFNQKLFVINIKQSKSAYK